MLGLAALDDVRGLPRENVQVAQLSFAGLVRMIPVCRDHPQQFATARKQRRGLDKVNARCQIYIQISCASYLP